MAIQLVDVGNSANDGQGDDLREAFIKVNESLAFLESISFQEGSNLGSAGAEVYKETTDNTLFFRRLVPGENIAIQQLDSTIQITNTQPESRFTITGNQGSIIAGAAIPITIFGQEATEIVGDDNNKTLTISSSLSRDPAPRLDTFLNADSHSILNIDTAQMTTLDAEFIGTAPYEERLGRYIEGFDGGDINIVVKSTLDYIVATTVIDFGTIQIPNSVDADLGVGFS